MLVCFLWLEVGRLYYLPLNAQISIDQLIVIGKHVITVEGLGNTENPHPLQERMAKLHGSQ
jgi:xanthine dehydrogenase/oxidase